MSPGSNTESYPAFAHIGLRENPGKNLNRPGIVPGPPGFAARRADRYSTGITITEIADIDNMSFGEVQVILTSTSKCMLHDYNAPAHRALATCQFCTRNKMVIFLTPRIHQILPSATFLVSEDEIQAKGSPFWHCGGDPTRIAEDLIVQGASSQEMATCATNDRLGVHHVHVNNPYCMQHGHIGSMEDVSVTTYCSTANVSEIYSLYKHREALRNATEPVHSGFDLNEAAKKFGVLKATLASRSNYPVEGKVFFGPRPVLGEAICNNIREMTHTCF
ncbi:hypothetical protein ANN_19020 [Periplaneta americana]|uniref:Uncharacterized protein n=1 Tax=Periplaneta americana TaxID=6978 RepID=A0ABQ8SQW6_PERAM|nr:hypothetical protein ANN_19020 [Periplaneta americana]